MVPMRSRTSIMSFLSISTNLKNYRNEIEEKVNQWIFLILIFLNLTQPACPSAP